MARRIALVTCLGSLWLAPAPGWASGTEDSQRRGRVSVIPSQYLAADLLHEEVVVDIVREQFALGSADTPHAKANVQIMYDDASGVPEYLIVYLLHKNSYRLEVERVILDLDLNVSFVEHGYQLRARDIEQTAFYRQKGSCPDESVEALFGCSETSARTCVQGATKAAEAAESHGFKAELLIGSDASVSALKNWLSCRALKVWGNIGHGSPSGISMSGGMISSSYFRGLQDDALTPKVLYFNSCQVHNDPLESSILGAGASRFIGGIVDLAMGSSEEVFKCFWEEAFATEGPMEPILKDCEQDHYYDRGAHGISGDGPLPWGANGSSCDDNAFCNSGYCVDGICCESACDHACRTCGQAYSLGSCVEAPNGLACADGDLCNGDETCQAGECAEGEALDCDDVNVCTEDACDPAVGCVHEAVTNGSPCLNETVCDGEEACRDGLCEAGTDLECDDTNICTADSCDAMDGCRHEMVEEGTDCASDQCGPATCTGGICMPDATDVCDDDNPCTVDSCEPKAGCTYVPQEDGYFPSRCTQCMAGEVVAIEGCTMGFVGRIGCASAETSVLASALVPIVGLWRRLRRFSWGFRRDHK